MPHTRTDAQLPWPGFSARSHHRHRVQYHATLKGGWHDGNLPCKRAATSHHRPRIGPHHPLYQRSGRSRLRGQHGHVFGWVFLHSVMHCISRSEVHSCAMRRYVGWIACVLCYPPATSRWRWSRLLVERAHHCNQFAKFPPNLPALPTNCVHVTTFPPQGVLDKITPSPLWCRWARNRHDHRTDGNGKTKYVTTESDGRSSPAPWFSTHHPVHTMVQ